MKVLTATAAYLSLIILTWYVAAIIAHAPPTNCGRACLAPGVTENPNITLIGEQ